MTTLPPSTLQKIDEAASRFCDAVMIATADMIRRSGKKADVDQVVEVLRDEVKSFFFGTTYANEREVILRGSVNAGYIVTTVALSAFNRLTLSDK